MMDILNNFDSLYCFITFVLGAVFMLAMIIIAAMRKVEEPTNKVRFYVKRVPKGLELWVKDRFGNSHFLYYIKFGDDYLIDTKPFIDMKEGEIRYVFLDLED